MYTINEYNYVNIECQKLKTFDILETDLNQIEGIRCYSNELTKLPQLPYKLELLSCHENRLTQLPPLPQSLESLYCDNNQLLELPPLPRFLKRLHCYKNPFIQFPQFPPNFSEIEISPWQVFSCLNNLSSPKTFIRIQN
jgi:Leucine-rich repeat (LRR) protein